MSQPILQYSPLDLANLPPVRVVLEPSTGTPATPANGRVWYDTSTGLPMVRAGGVDYRMAVKSIVDADVSASAAIAESKLSLATDAAAGTGSRRTLGLTATQAMPGNTRLDQIAVPTSALSLNGQRLTNVADPTTGTDGANQQWTQNQISAAITGQDWKPSVRVSSTANVTVASPGTTIDGKTMVANDRVLLKNQTTASQNGVYVWNGSAVPMTRALDADTNAEVTNGMTVQTEEGTANAGTLWVLTTPNPIVLGTTSLTFTQIGAPGATYTAGNGLGLAGNVFSLTAPVTIANGGTNAITAAAARTSLNVPQRGYAADVGAITAGSSTTLTHGLGTDDLVVNVRDKASGDHVNMKINVSSTLITFYSDATVTSAQLRVTAMAVA